MHYAKAITTGSAKQQPDTLCVRLWIDGIFPGVENSHCRTHSNGFKMPVILFFGPSVSVSLSAREMLSRHQRTTQVFCLTYQYAGDGIPTEFFSLPGQMSGELLSYPQRWRFWRVCYTKTLTLPITHELL